MQSANTLPDQMGHFGQFGGRFVPETLMPAVHELEREYRAAQADETFQAEMRSLAQHYVGRPTALYHAENLSRDLGGDMPSSTTRRATACSCSGVHPNRDATKAIPGRGVMRDGCFMRGRGRLRAASRRRASTRAERRS